MQAQGLDQRGREPTRQGARALAYRLRRGWSVFPCIPGDKKPLGSLVRHGLLDATNDETKIADWWTVAPDANIGIATGERSGFFVVDVDSRHGGLNLDRVDGGIMVRRELPLSTPSGGMHLYFEMPRRA